MHACIQRIDFVRQSNLDSHDPTWKWKMEKCAESETKRNGGDNGSLTKENTDPKCIYQL